MPCAGRGSKLGVPIKELYRVRGRPLIDYSLDRALEMGCRDILLIIAPGKEAVAEYVAKQNILNVSTVYQTEPHGTGHALACAAPWISQRSLLYLMPDTITSGKLELSMWTSETVAHVWTWPTAEPEKRGCFSFKIGTGRVTKHVEKQRPDWEPPYFAWGAARLGPHFADWCAGAWNGQWWQKYARKNRGNASEFTIDDAFDLLLERGSEISASRVDGAYFDCGTSEEAEAAETWLKFEQPR